MLKETQWRETDWINSPVIHQSCFSE